LRASRAFKNGALRKAAEAAIDEATWNLLSTISNGIAASRVDQLREALRRGLLVPQQEAKQA
jgi:hypothetical protein